MKKKRKKYTKRTTRQKLIDELKKVHSLIIRKRTPYCVVCGSRELLQCGHLFTCVNLSTKFDLQEDGNCHTQCAGCNSSHEHDSYPYNHWYIERFGIKRFDALHIRHKTTKKYSIPELQDLLVNFKTILEELD
ncbi:MAG: recombination protein NinG [Candidatus Peribacteraceae bacterium]|nr:recombination protein NinG [Candidatus Peribacteraceae bacterium]